MNRSSRINSSTVRLLVDTHKDVTLLPNYVIQRNSDGAFVYLVAAQPNGRLCTPITVGTTDGNVSEVQALDSGHSGRRG